MSETEATFWRMEAELHRRERDTEREIPATVCLGCRLPEDDCCCGTI